MSDTLPIDAVLPDLIDALRDARQSVLQAPPGAGKTTRVPLALLEAGLVEGRILMLEPRRLATRGAAVRMAETLGEKVGRTVGYRMRGESRVSDATRIEVVTEGILTRMIQSDPMLDGVGTVIFDEFHERSLNADLGLALTLDLRSALREDLVLLVMSATLDAGPVAELMGGAPVVTSEGQSFPVETRWLDRPRAKGERVTETVLRHLPDIIEETDGAVLVFLPGEGEIRNVMGALGGTCHGAEILPLYGALGLAEQRRALTPTGGRRVVLSTAIAETSLTIPDVRAVVDGGLARRARFNPGSGMSRLVTERVTRAEADQRRGRAGRVAEGVCLRLWTRGEEGALLAHPPAEIEAADLAPLALDLAEWGSDDLPFLTPPPEGALAEARALLRDLGALEASGSLTEHGRRIARVPTHPRLAHTIDKAGKSACLLAALLADRDPLRGEGVDLTRRLKALKGNGKGPGLDRIRGEAKRLAQHAGEDRITDPAEQAALAYPDRIALRRPGNDPRWLLSGGKGAKMEAGDALAGARLLVVTDTDGHPREARIWQAIEITEKSLREVLGDRIETVREVRWSARAGRVEAVEEERLGALVLAAKRWDDAPEEDVARAMLEGVREFGLGLSEKGALYRARVELGRDGGLDLPDLSDAKLLETMEDWLLPYLDGVRTASAWKSFDILPALKALVGWEGNQALDRVVPATVTTPLGREVAVDYSGEDPEIAVRLQEMFGTTEHPRVGGKPLRVTLLSPAGRPLQTTMDLPGFWQSSYADVRKDMRGRYPKHPWPEDPTEAAPTLRAKPRKG